MKAPARRDVRAGAFVLLALGGLLAAACDRVPGRGDDGPRVLELAHDTIRLPAGTRLVDIEVRREASGEFHPAAAQARVGDYVRFTAGDHAGHAIAFLAASTDPAVVAWLDQTAQLRGPPLISSGSSWVITLDGAPPGEYPFHCTTHNVAGRLNVAVRQDP